MPHDEYAALAAAFLADHPEHLQGIRYRQLAAGEEPALLMNTETLTAFLHWADAHGYVERRDLLPDLVRMIRALS